MAKEVNNHDYQKSLGDRFLALIRSVVRDPEKRHHSLATLAKYSGWIPKPRMQGKESVEHVIRFKDRSNPLYLSSPILLAAGANKEAEYISKFAGMGFGGVTVGTATRSEREGNTFRPRVRMYTDDRVIQNAMGLNNPGIDEIVKRVDHQYGKAHKEGLSVGISVAESPGIEDYDERLEDVIYSFREAYKVADYVEVNLSCPNTGHDRIDNQLKFLDEMLGKIMELRRNLSPRRAVFAKLSPDLGPKQLHQILDMVEEHQLSGLVLFNTFPGNRAKYLPDFSHCESVLEPVGADGMLGGISGRPLYINTYKAVEYIKERHPNLSIIASGGVDCGAKAYDLMQAGADAVQIYSVMSYRWFPAIKIQNEIRACLRDFGYTSLSESLED